MDCRMVNSDTAPWWNAAEPAPAAASAWFGDRLGHGAAKRRRHHAPIPEKFPKFPKFPEFAGPQQVL